MENSCITEVKAILKSLVLSSTDKMTIEQLNRDYRDIEGESIPFRRLGYTNIEEFFHAIPDTLKVFGRGPTATVCFVANEKSVHIHDMIMKQKKPRSRTRNRNRRRNGSRSSTNNRFNNNKQPVKNIPGHQLSPFQNINRKNTVRTVKLWNEPPPAISSTSDCYALPQPSGIVLHNNTNVKAPEEHNIKKYEEHVKQASNLLKKNCFITQSPPPPLPLSRATKNNCFETKKIQSMKETKTEIDSEVKEPPLPLSKATKNSCFEAKKIQSMKETKTKIDSEVKEPSNELKAATFKASDKVNDLLQSIKAPKAKEKSETMKLSSDIEKLTKIRNVKFLNPIRDRCTSDFELKEVASKTDKVMDLKLKELSIKLFDVSDEKEGQKDEAIPSFAAKYNVFRLDFPEHTVPFGNKIAPFKIPKDIEVGSCIKIFVSEIHSPFRFWFHLYKEDHELDLLMCQIERFYSSLSADDLRIPLTSIMPGQVCAALFSGIWHRAEIVAPPVNNTVKVSFMDYGTVYEAKIDEIKFLASYFAQLPAQALRGCLSHIKPRQLHWNHKATLHFLNLTSEVMLYAKITEIDIQNQTLYMILCNTNDDEIVQINTSLVENRYAFYNTAWKTEKIRNNNGIRQHHPREDFPTFSMIEAGEYPNFTELFNLQKRGIDYEAIYDMLLYNPNLILNKHENVPEIIRNLPYFLTTTNPFRSDIILESYTTTSTAV